MHPLTRQNRLLLLVLVCGLAVSGGYVADLCLRRSDVRFLPEWGEAKWIIFPRPPDAIWHRNCAELESVFRSAFTLRLPPAAATLSVRAFKRGRVTVNGTVLPDAAAAERNWKKPLVFEVSQLLRPGTNTLAISVFNDYGPPAVWAELRGDNLRLLSDESWEASYAGSVWRPARLASKPMAAGVGNPVLCGQRTLSALRARWPTLAGLALLSVVLLLGWARLAGAAPPQTAPGASSLLADPAKVVLAGTIFLWLLLFTHNIGLLPGTLGFDAQTHTDYISYIMERKALPLAHEGASMYNPPLYYLLSAGLLGLLSLAPGTAAGTAVLRAFSLVIGLAQLVLVFGCLRLLFPNQQRKQVVGLLLAAFLPMQIYVSHYVTNETLLATLVTATIYLCLRLTRAAQVSTAACAVLGLSLGAALLTKFTAVLLVPFIIGAVAGRIWRQHARSPWAWLRTLGVLLAVCFAVCGWHYLRIWIHYGKPLVGAWEPISGHRWWQDEGYCTMAHFLRFGQSLVRPVFSVFHGFWDGIYSSLWGDAMCGGMAAVDSCPPWNYDLMAVGYWLALLPTLAILLGAAWAVWQFIRQPSADWLVLNGLAFAFALAFIYMALQVPYYSQIKAFYGLLTLLPLCAFGGAGFDLLSRRGRVAGAVAGLALGAWALNTFAAFWIREQSAKAQTMYAEILFENGRQAEAVEQFRLAALADPQNIQVRSFLAQSLAALGRITEARQVAEQTLKDHPNDALCHLDFASALQMQGELEPAIAHVRRGIALAPDHPRAPVLLAGMLARLQRRQEVIQACREGLRILPADPQLHFLLGSALAAPPSTNESQSAASGPGNPPADLDARMAEARQHFRIASQTAADSPVMLNDVAWVLATHPSGQIRDGPEAVRLAERACRLTQYRTALLVGTLAAAYAEAGRFGEAVTTAQKAKVLAEASGQTRLAALNEKLAVLFRDGTAYRQSDNLETSAQFPK